MGIGSNIQLVYRSYRITYNVLIDRWLIAKYGKTADAGAADNKGCAWHHVGFARSEADAKRQIDQLVG